MRLFHCAAIALVLQAPAPTWAQGLEEKIWAVVAFTTYGDSTPTLLPRSRTLTSLGAHDLYTAGSIFRKRYVNPITNGTSSTRIQKISPYMLDSSEVNVYSTTDQFIAASAQAFMQGLYPPLEHSYNETYIDATNILANGSVIDFPLNGYQYPRIYTAGLTDSNSISVAGQADCYMHLISEWQYQNGPEFKQIAKESAAFYAYLYDVALYGVYEPHLANYANAYYISEYLEHQYLHNSTVSSLVTPQDLHYARLLADQYVFATNGNLTASGLYKGDRIRAVAGRTLAQLIVESFEASIRSQGSEGKMNLVFGGFEPAVALAALLQLADPMYENFYGLPARGASLAFELYSFEDDSTSPAYPSASDLNVRFLLRNSTNSSVGFTYYPLFGYGPSQIAIPYTEFKMEMEQIMMPSTQQWCTTCNASSVFCSGQVDNNSFAGLNRGLSAGSAGVIGACVTLVTLAFIAALAFLLCGIRINPRQRSELGGFKGSGKLASDRDVTFKDPAGGTVKTMETDAVENGASGAVVRGHERVGSWEMGERKKETGNMDPANAPKTRPSFEQDEDDWQVSPFADPVKAHESV
ncbi:hypothetical protein VTN00DRAFT_9862 [Thermoascus crustaceus]|uniref:uncharacterized protein n=1 Tax=Thermoascus crustaceus TaxID=5088 RepID=UPI0037425B88